MSLRRPTFFDPFPTIFKMVGGPRINACFVGENADGPTPRSSPKKLFEVLIPKKMTQMYTAQQKNPIFLCSGAAKWHLID